MMYRRSLLLVLTLLAGALIAALPTDRSIDQHEIFPDESWPACVEVPGASFQVFTSFKAPNGNVEDLPGLVIDVRGSNCSDYPGLVVDTFASPPSNRVDATAGHNQSINVGFAQIPHTDPTFKGMIWSRVNVQRSQEALDFLTARGLRPVNLSGAATYAGTGTKRTIGKRGIMVDKDGRGYYLGGYYEFILWTEAIPPATTTPPTTQPKPPTTTTPPTTQPKPPTTTAPPAPITTQPPAPTPETTLAPVPETTLAPPTSSNLEPGELLEEQRWRRWAELEARDAAIDAPTTPAPTSEPTEPESTTPTGAGNWRWAGLLVLPLLGSVIWAVRRRRR